MATAPTSDFRVHRVTVAAGILAVVGVLGAVVILSLAGKSPTDIAALFAVTAPLVAAVLAALDKLSKNLDETREQTSTLAVIDHRTNGQLDSRIGSAVDAALARRFGTTPPATPPMETP